MSGLTHLSLFSGIGGLDLAAEWAGFRTVGQCEWADYPHAVLQKHWPGVPKWRDIRTFTKESFYERTGLETVTVLSGGFPCQPFSKAGKRRGKEDDRYLWPEMLRVIQQIRPAWVVGENVAGLVSMELDTVLSGLENIGYACQTLIVPACAVDAPHRRDRCVILGFDTQRNRWRADCDKPDNDKQRNDPASEQGWRSELRPTGSGGGDVPDAQSWGEQRQFSSRGQAWGFGGQSRWPAEPNVGRVAHGIPARVDRLKCLGNAVVPQQFWPVFRAIADMEENLWNLKN